MEQSPSKESSSYTHTHMYIYTNETSVTFQSNYDTLTNDNYTALH